MTMRIAIVGLGLIGSSMGLSLKQTEATFEIVGHDKDGEAAKRALKGGCVDRTEWNLISACDGADLVVMSIPLAGMQDTLKAIAQDLKAGCVVTDTASLKVPVLNWAKELLAAAVHFVGGHPIVGPGVRDSAAPSADLFAGATYCLTPGTNTSQEALQTVSDLAEAVGARPYYVDAAEHDGLIAALEHLPLVMALGLQAMVGMSPSHREMMQLSGRDFSGVTQPLVGSEADLASLCISNADNVARWLDVLLTELSRLRELVADQDGESLQKCFAEALAMRNKWGAKPAGGEAVDYSDFSMTHMLLGDTFARRQKQAPQSRKEKVE